MTKMIDISGLDKGEVLFALYNASRYQGLSHLDAVDSYTLEDAKADYEASSGKYFDYLHGKVLKVDLDGDSFDPYLFNRDCGEEAAEKAIEALRKSKNG